MKKMGQMLNFLFFLSIIQKGMPETLSSICEKSQVDGIDFFCGKTSQSDLYQPCPDFELAYGSATSTTRLWFLGELHSEGEKTASCVDALTKDVKDHVVYAEGVQAGEKFSCDLAGISKKPGRICKGWDDSAAVREFMKLFSGSEETVEKQKIARQLQDLKKTYQKDKAAGMSDKAYEEKLKQVKAAIEGQVKANIVKKQFSDNAINIMFKAIHWVLEQRKKVKSFQEVFATPFETYRPEGYAVNTKNLDKAQKLRAKRDKIFLETVSKHPKGQFGIFIIGRDHLTSTLEDPLAKSSEKNMKKDLEEFADENRFAVLTMQ